MRSIPAWAGEPICSQVTLSTPPVYPRVGGGTFKGVNVAWSYRGLSPRGRGNRPAVRCDWLSKRSIPAWAGEPLLAVPCRSLYTVYPRVGGGTAGEPPEEHSLIGLSPRGRGNPWL